MKETVLYTFLKLINRILFRIPKKILTLIQKVLKKSYRVFIFRFILFYDFLMSKWFHHQDTFQIYHCNTKQNKSNLCIFSHFDANNIIDPYVIFYLQELANNDCDIIFVSASSSLSTAERDKIAPYCKQIIIRRNRGRDFGSFKCGIMNTKDIIPHYEKIILANDSIYGPFFDIAPIIHFGSNNHLDMWGVSDSLEKNYHIQSFFVVFNKKILNDPAFLAFWERVHYFGERQNIINHYEIGMSKYFQQKGYPLGAFCDYQIIQNDLLSQNDLMNKIDKKFQKLLNKHCPVNPTHAFWDIIITNYQFPFLKRELLMHNPESLDISNWKEVVKAHSPYKVDLIANHLLRLSTRA